MRKDYLIGTESDRQRAFAQMTSEDIRNDILDTVREHMRCFDIFIPEDLHDILQEVISKRYKSNLLIRNIRVLKHYKKKKINFYVVDVTYGIEGSYLYGFLIEACDLVKFITVKEIKLKKYKLIKNNEDCITMGMVFDFLEESDI